MKKRAAPMPATADQREAAGLAAAALRSAIADPTSAGRRIAAHILLANPRRGLWILTWENLPGFTRYLGRKCCTHDLLPGWEYTGSEVRSEMVGDLEHLAATGELPTEASR